MAAFGKTTLYPIGQKQVLDEATADAGAAKFYEHDNVLLKFIRIDDSPPVACDRVYPGIIDSDHFRFKD